MLGHICRADLGMDPLAKLQTGSALAVHGNSTTNNDIIYHQHYHYWTMDAYLWYHHDISCLMKGLGHCDCDH